MLDEVLHLQLPQGLPHRGAADPQLLGQLLLRELVAGAVLAADDGLADQVVDFVPDGPHPLFGQPFHPLSSFFLMFYFVSWIQKVYHRREPGAIGGFANFPGSFLCRLGELGYPGRGYFYSGRSSI